MSKDNRPIIVGPTLGRLRQGLLFDCASAAGYQGSNAYGLIVTAHCDLAHDKAHVINFVPVVSLRDWLRCDAEVVLARRMRGQLLKFLLGQLTKMKLSAMLLETESVEVVVRQFILSETSGASKKEREQAHAAPAAIAEAERILGGGQPNGSMAAWFPKDARKVLEELLKNALAGYYFLPCVSPGGEHNGYVALLRQIYSLPRVAANEVARGVAMGSLREMWGSGLHPGIETSRADGDLLVPVGQVASPYLEHVMQAFGQLFTRIGVADIAESFQLSIVGSHFDDGGAE